MDLQQIQRTGDISISSVVQLLFRHTCWKWHPYLRVNTLPILSSPQYTPLKKQMLFPMSSLKLANVVKDERALQSLVVWRRHTWLPLIFCQTSDPSSQEIWASCPEIGSAIPSRKSHLVAEPCKKSKFNPHVCVNFRETNFSGVFYSFSREGIQAKREKRSDRCPTGWTKPL